MGATSSQLNAQFKEQQAQTPVKGHWVSDIKTGYRWATDPITSDSSITKVPLGQTIPGFEKDNNLKMIFSLPKLPGEVWGPYKKQFTRSSFGGQVFTPPESVDGVPILCRCRDIPEYMRDKQGGHMVQGFGAVAAGAKPPACWEDSEAALLGDVTGGLKYYIMTRHPSFYAFAASKNGLLGVAKSVAEGPVGPVPLALGAWALLRGGTRKKYRKHKRKQTKKRQSSNTRGAKYAMK